MLTFNRLKYLIDSKYGFFKYPFNGIVSECVFEPFANYVIIFELLSKKYGNVIDKISLLSDTAKSDLNRFGHTDILIDVYTGYSSYTIDADLKMERNGHIFINDKTQMSFNRKISDNPANKNWIVTFKKADKGKWHLYCCDYNCMLPYINRINGNAVKDIHIPMSYIVGDGNTPGLDVLYPETCDKMYCNWPNDDRYWFLNYICRYFEEIYKWSLNKDSIIDIYKDDLAKLTQSDRCKVFNEFINIYNGIQMKYVSALPESIRPEFHRIFD